MGRFSFASGWLWGAFLGALAAGASAGIIGRQDGPSPSPEFARRREPSPQPPDRFHQHGHKEAKMPWTFGNQEAVIDYGNGKTGSWKRDYVIREDGAKIIIKEPGSGPLKGDYTYTHNGTEFTFGATCYDRDGDPFDRSTWRLSDAWTVTFGYALRDLEKARGRELSPEEARAIADVVEEGLLAWPNHNFYTPYEYIKATRVRFKMGGWTRWSAAWGWGEPS